MGNRCRVLVVDPGGHTFRHPADDKIAVVGFQQAVVEDFFNGLILPDAFVVSKERRVGGLQEFVEGERAEVEQIDHAHRVGLWLREQGAKQAPGCDDMVLVRFLFEVFERIERLRAFLHLIKNDESLPGQNLFPRDHGKELDNALRVFVRLENGFQLVFLVKVEVDIAFIAALPKLLHEPGLPDLTRAADDKRLPFGGVFPLFKVVYCAALQLYHHRHGYPIK